MTYSIILALAEIYVIYYLMTDYSHLGAFMGIFDIKYTIIMVLYLFFIALSVSITGFIFSLESIRMDDPDIRFKGKVLLIAFLTYSICGVVDAAIDLTEITLIIIRSITMAGAILFYIGFFVPKFIKKRLKHD